MALLRWLGFLLLLPFLLVIVLVALVALVVIVPISLVRRRYRHVTGGRPWQWFRARRGWGLGIDELARRLDIPADELSGFSPRYRTVFIKKRTGGERRLLVPDKHTKALQRRVLHRVLRRLRAHDAAIGFERGRSIVHNAVQHAGQSVVVRLDVVDFFPATAPARLEQYFRRIGWSKAAAELLVRITTHDDGLPQGAPTSPRLSNLVNYLLDVQMTRLAERWRGDYTRYADDITFSFPEDYPRHVRGVIQKARRILKSHGYRMHRRPKLHVRRQHQRQIVTGLVVNEDVNLPRWRRRQLRAVRHRLKTGRQATMSPAQLQGWDALQSMIRTQAEDWLRDDDHVAGADAPH
jgi:hypothetical protein